jgi:hypothetical protein
VQRIRRVRQQIAMLVHGAALELPPIFLDTDLSDRRQMW